MVGVVPVGACIRRDKVVEEGLSRLDRLLGEVGNAVHRVWQADAVPVDGRLLVELVFDSDPQTIALPHSELPPGHSAAVSEHGGADAGIGQQASSTGLGGQLDIAFVSCEPGAAGGGRCRGSGSAEHETSTADLPCSVQGVGEALKIHRTVRAATETCVRSSSDRGLSKLVLGRAGESPLELIR